MIHNNLLLVQLLRLITTAHFTRMAWLKNLGLSVAGAPMRHCDWQILVTFDDSLLFKCNK